MSLFRHHDVKLSVYRRLKSVRPCYRAIDFCPSHCPSFHVSLTLWKFKRYVKHFQRFCSNVNHLHFILKQFQRLPVLEFIWLFVMREAAPRPAGWLKCCSILKFTKLGISLAVSDNLPWGKWPWEAVSYYSRVAAARRPLVIAEPAGAPPWYICI